MQVAIFRIDLLLLHNHTHKKKLSSHAEVIFCKLGNESRWTNSDGMWANSYNVLTRTMWSKANFSFQLIASYVWYSMEELAGDLLFGLKLVKLSILPTLFIHFVQGRLGELRSVYLGLLIRLNASQQSGIMYYPGQDIFLMSLLTEYTHFLCTCIVSVYTYKYCTHK